MTLLRPQIVKIKECIAFWHLQLFKTRGFGGSHVKIDECIAFWHLQLNKTLSFGAPMAKIEECIGVFALQLNAATQLSLKELQWVFLSSPFPLVEFVLQGHAKRHTFIKSWNRDAQKCDTFGNLKSCRCPKRHTFLNFGTPDAKRVIHSAILRVAGAQNAIHSSDLVIGTPKRAIHLAFEGLQVPKTPYVQSLLNSGRQTCHTLGDCKSCRCSKQQTFMNSWNRDGKCCIRNSNWNSCWCRSAIHFLILMVGMIITGVWFCGLSDT